MIDSFLTALAIGVLGASLLAVSGFYVSGALALAICFGGATLTKSIGWGFALLVPFSVLANPVPISELGKYRHRRHLHRMVVSSAIGLLLGAFIYYIVFGSSPAAELIRQFEAQYGKYTLSLGELLRFPFERWFANASMVFGWLVRLLTPPILILAVAGLTNLPKLGQKAWVLGAWVLFPTVGQILIANRFYSRYILFSIPPLLIIAAILLDRSYDFITTQMAKQQQAKQIKYLQIIAIVLFTGLLVWPVQATARKVLDGELAKETGYYSIYEAAEFIENQAERAPQTVIVAYSPSPVEDGMAVLLSKAPDVRVLRVALIEGQLTIFDPAQKLSIASVSLDAATTYFAALAGAEESSWLAGKIDPTHAFESPNGNNVVLYRIRFDASFR